MTTYSNLGIALIGTGEESGTWGTVTNNNLQYALQEPIANTIDVAVSGGGVTDTMTWNPSLNTTQAARFLRFNLTGSGGGTGNLVVPTLSAGKNYIVNNSSNSIITVKTAAGTGIAIGAGSSRSVYQDGTDVVVVDDYNTDAASFTTLAVSGAVTGNGFVARFASPGPIGDVTASTGAFTTGTFTTGTFTTLSTTGNATFGDALTDIVTFNAATASIPNNLAFSGTGSLTLPKGTVAQRPTAVAGMIRYNTDTNVLEVYTGSAWVAALTTPAVGTTVQPYSTNLNALSTNGTGTGTSQYVQRPAASAIAIGSTFTVTETGGVLYFSVSGVNKAKIDASGNLTVVGNVTAYGTV